MMKRIKELAKGIVAKAVVLAAVLVGAASQAQATLTVPDVGVDASGVIGDAAVAVGGVVLVALGAWCAFLLVRIAWRAIKKLG